MNAASIQHFARRLGGPGVGALVCGLAAAIVFLLAGSTLLSAASVPSAVLVAQAEKERKTSEEKYRDSFTGYLAQINGRSLFIIPGAPTPPPPKTVDIASDKTPAPPPPSSYGGPSLIGMINGVVWFNDGKKLAAGESDGDLKVVEIKPPWSAVVKWKDVQFTVGLFDRDTAGNPWADHVAASSSADSSEPMMGPEAPPDAFDTPGKPPEGGGKPGDGKPGDPKSPPPLPPRPPEEAGNTEPPPPPDGGPGAPPPPPPPESARTTPPESI